MTDLIIHSRGENWTTSNLVAEKLGKQHNNVMAKIRKLLEDLNNLTAKTLAVRNDKKKFVLETFTSSKGQTYERYRMNKPAFSLLIMQMSGQKALDVQDSFNNAFYDMEQYILKLQNTKFIAAREQGKIARAEVTDAIKELVDHATTQGSQNAKHYYAIITSETYKALGYLAQGEKVGSEFRNHLDNFQLAELFIAESLASQVIAQGVADKLHYKEIYLLAKQKVNEFGRSQDALRIKPNQNTPKKGDLKSITS